MTESLNVDIILEEDTPNIDVDVESQAASFSEILRNDTLIGDGIDTPLGVNTETIATVNSLNQGLELKQNKGNYALKEEIPDLTDYVKKTDYATASKAGLIRPTPTYGLNVSESTGVMYSVSIPLGQYETVSTAHFISKGTLNNVLTQYSKTVLTTEADYNALETKDANTLYLIEE